MRADSAWACLYFILIVSFGGFYIVNLFLAVIFKEFVETKTVESAVKQAKQDAAQAKARIAVRERPAL